ncbi:MAG: DUF1772 domain-containing protein [Gemmatimonadales bacterium]
MIVAALAVLCAGLFAGAALYVTAVEHPARLSCGSALALRQFAPSYRRGARLQASLALAGLVLAAGGWYHMGHLLLLIGGLVLGAVVPFTLLVIYPTNHRLLAPTLAPESPEAEALLRRWGHLHAVRTLLGVLAFAILLAGLGHGL